MRAIDITHRVMPNDMYPYDSYKVVLKPQAHLNYSYVNRKECFCV
jgi:hypothetical protein